MNAASCIAAALLLGSPAAPAAQEKGLKVEVPAASGDVTFVVAGSKLAGMTVENRNDEPLGKVDGVIVYPSGDIAFVVMSFTGAMQEGGRLIPVPWIRIDANHAKKALILDVPKERLKDAPGFKSTNWPDLANIEWFAEINDYYGVREFNPGQAKEATAKLGEVRHYLRQSELVGRAVENREGEDLGSIKEIVFDPEAGRATYFVLSVGGFLGMGDKAVAVPWGALEILPDPENPKLERLVLAVTKEKLEAAPEFLASEEGWKQMSDRKWIVTVYEHWGVPTYWTVETR